MSAHLRVDAALDRLSDVRRFVREQVTAAAAPAECLDDVVQAVDEAATNVINHGYRGKDGWQFRGIGALAADMRWPLVGQLWEGRSG